jgi:hypothetical protein
MATKKFYVEQVLRILQGGNIPRDSPITERELAAWMDDTRDAMITKLFNANLNKASLDSSLRGDLVSTYTSVAVATDSDTSRKYIPVKQAISLDLDRGYVGVWIQGGMTPLIPTRIDSGLYTGLKSADLQGRLGYYNERTSSQVNRLYFTGDTTQIRNGDFMVVKLIARGNEIGLTDEYPVHSLFQDDIKTLALQKYGGMPSINRNLDGR